MKQLTYSVIIMICLLSYSNQAAAQDDRFYGNDPVSGNSKSKPKVDLIMDISPDVLDSLDLKAIAVETHLGYCDDAEAAIIIHRQHGAAIVSNKGPGCPLSFTFKEKVKEVSISFTGCAGKYKIVGYDAAGKKVAENTMEIGLWETERISLQVNAPNIASVTFGRGTGCSTFVKGIEFE